MSNIEIRISADTTSLVSQLAIAKAEFSATQKALNDLAKEAAKNGLSDGLKADMQQASEAMLKAQNSVSGLKNELQNLKPPAQESSGAMSLMGEAMGALGPAAAAMGLAVSAQQMLAFGNAAFEAAAQIDHAAAVAGVGSEALQAYRAAFVETGGTEDEADTLMKRLTKSIGTATDTVGPARQAFVQLGLSMDDLKGGTENVVPLIARGLLGIQDASERARIEFELTGRSGQELEPALSALAAPTADLIEKMRDLHQVLDPGVTGAAQKTQVGLSESWKKISDDTVPIMNDMKSGLQWFLDHAEIPIRFVLNGDADIQDFIDKAAKQDKPGADPDYAPGVDEPAPKQKADWSTPDLDAYIAKEQQAANLAGELPRQRAIDSAAIEAATLKLKDQGAAETKIITTAQQARTILGSQYDTIASAAAKAYDGSTKSMNQAAAAAKHDLDEQKKDYAAFQAEIDQMSRDDLSTKLQLGKMMLDAQITNAQADYDAHKITAQQKYDIDMNAAKQEHDDQVKALQDDQNLSTTTVQQANADANKIKIIDEQLTNAQANLARKLTDDQKQEMERRVAAYRSMANELLSAEDQLVGNIFNSNQTLTQDMLQMGVSLLQHEIANDLKAMTTRMLFSKEEIAADKSLQTQGMLYHLFTQDMRTANTEASQLAQTSATASGAASRTATEISADTASQMASQSIGQEQIMQDAYKAAAGAYSAVSSIPYVGPYLAPIAAGAAFIAVEAFGQFDKGMDIVPSDMIAQIHQGERIIPAADNSKLMDMAARGGGGQNVGVTHQYGDIHMHWNVSTMDAKSFKDFIGGPQTKAAMIGALGSAVRLGMRPK